MTQFGAFRCTFVDFCIGILCENVKQNSDSNDDKDAWQLQTVIRYSKMQLEDINSKLAAVFDLGFFVAGLVTAGTGMIANATSRIVVSAVIDVMRRTGSVAFDLVSFKEELSYSQYYTLIDGYNSTMSCTIYFDKNSNVLGKSNPFIFTN